MLGSGRHGRSFTDRSEVGLDSPCRRGLLIEEREVDLLVGHAAGPALDPAGALRVVVDAVVVGVVGGIGLEGPGLLDGVAMGR